MAILDERPGDVLVGDVEAPVFASWARRVVAALLDSAILTATGFLAGGHLHGVAWWVSFSGTPSAGAAVVVASGVLLLMQALTGATPGKRVTGIRVVREGSGSPAGVLRTLVREVAHVVDAICYLGYLRPLVHPRGRTFADSAVRTDVVIGRPGPLVRGVDAWTAAAGVVCLLAVGFAQGGSAAFTSLGAAGCTSGKAEADQVQVDLQPTSATSVTRLGVTRTGPPTADLVATWTFPAGTVPPEGSVLSSTVTASDGTTVARSTTQVGGDGSDPDADPTASGTWTVRIPAERVAGGPGWRWHADLTTPDGRTTEMCAVAPFEE